MVAFAVDQHALSKVYDQFSISADAKKVGTIATAGGSGKNYKVDHRTADSRDKHGYKDMQEMLTQSPFGSNLL